MSKHATKTICPRCEIRFINHVHCANRGCPYHVHTCDACDNAQAVAAFMADHAKDCRFIAPVLVRPTSERAAA